MMTTKEKGKEIATVSEEECDGGDDDDDDDDDEDDEDEYYYYDDIRCCHVDEWWWKWLWLTWIREGECNLKWNVYNETVSSYQLYESPNTWPCEDNDIDPRNWFGDWDVRAYRSDRSNPEQAPK